MNSENELAIKNKLTAAFPDSEFQIINDSHLHCGPSNESHFRVYLVDDGLKGKNTLARQREFNAALGDIFSKVHSVSAFLFTIDEWEIADKKMAPAIKCAGKRTA